MKGGGGYLVCSGACWSLQQVSDGVGRAGVAVLLESLLVGVLNELLRKKSDGVLCKLLRRRNLCTTGMCGCCS